MNFNNDKNFGAFRKDIASSDVEKEKKLIEEGILDSNNVELIAKYAKDNRSKEAIDKVRELLESARKTGEEVVQNFLNAFKECENKKISYLNFENTDSGKLALSLLEKMPEPFKTAAYQKLEKYKKELQLRAELFEKHNDPREIWKEITGFDYVIDSSFKERFKTFLFEDVRGLFKTYHAASNNLEIRNNPFAVEFLIKDADSYNKLHSSEMGNSAQNTGGFFQGKYDIDISAINDTHKPSQLKNSFAGTSKHESEHAVHKKTNLVFTKTPNASRLGIRLYNNAKFESSKRMINGGIREGFCADLDRAKDEIFAHLKGGSDKTYLVRILSGKDVHSSYDYARYSRDESNKAIINNEFLLSHEKQQLKEAINFLQSEYERVLNNMIDVIYEKYQSVEFFRNVPINELWKYSNGKYSRTDFIIKEFKF